MAVLYLWVVQNSGRWESYLSMNNPLLIFPPVALGASPVAPELVGKFPESFRQNRRQLKLQGISLGILLENRDF
jgi:hypothetical protein